MTQIYPDLLAVLEPSAEMSEARWVKPREPGPVFNRVGSLRTGASTPLAEGRIQNPPACRAVVVERACLVSVLALHFPIGGHTAV